MTLAAPFLKRISLLKDRADPDAFPFDRIGFLNDPGFALEFPRRVTFFVGENGSGKSTVLEAIAALCDFPVGGGSQDHRRPAEGGRPPQPAGGGAEAGMAAPGAVGLLPARRELLRPRRLYRRRGRHRRLWRARAARAEPRRIRPCAAVEPAARHGPRRHSDGRARGGAVAVAPARLPRPAARVGPVGDRPGRRRHPFADLPLLSRRDALPVRRGRHRRDHGRTDRPFPGDVAFLANPARYLAEIFGEPEPG